MSDATVARRYAQALYQEAESEGNVDRIDEDMQSVQESLDASRELDLFFRSPLIAREKKQAVVGKLFDGKVAPLIERLGIVEARVRTAMPMEFDETEDLRKALEAKTGKKVRLRIEVEPELIGGAVVRIGDRVYDGSVQHQLESLRDQLEERAYLSN